ncbi:Methionine--tRNA ligase [compost metagenome]
MSQQEKRKILITTALPYANGYIHLGHLVEYLQADFWTRFQNMRGNECIYICADDTHGTPIMVRAREMGITPEQLIAASQEEHTKDFADFQVEFSHYGSTNSPENKALCEEFYGHMKAKGHIDVRDIKQLYCNHDKMFLPDRFVKGTCPKCKSKEQYGDSCDVCGATYSPADMTDVHCAICGSTPVEKLSEHIFFKLNDFKKYLEEWLPKHTAPEVSKKMMEWFNEDLRDWDISRDEPYFGFAIPGTDNKKFFYVWVDAPMGYISSTLQWCKKNGRDLAEFWKGDKAEVYHFIGKDITYFHTLFWPALLKAADYRSPSQVFVHGHLMVNGEKMSKSKGTFVAARTYLNHLNPEYLRYYYATKLSGNVDDIDLNLEDFVNRVNSDLVGKITNLGSRGGQMLKKKMDGTMSTPDAEGLKLLKHAQEKNASIAAHFEARDFGKGLTEIRSLADEANKYFDEKAPWKTLESDPAGTKQVITTTLNLFRILAIYLKPFLPHYTAKVEKLMGEKNYQWADAQKILENRPIADYEHLAVRIEADKVKAMVEESRKINEELQAQKKAAALKASASAPAAAAKAAPPAEDRHAKAAEIDFADFEKVDLRIGQVVEAEAIKEADKLLRLKVDIGNGEIRQIIAGIKAAYAPEKLLGRKVLVCVNLKPRKMKFGMSEGMVLAAGDGGSDLFVLSADEGAKVGQRVK